MWTTPPPWEEAKSKPINKCSAVAVVLIPISRIHFCLVSVSWVSRTIIFLIGLPWIISFNRLWWHDHGVPLWGLHKSIKCIHLGIQNITPRRWSWFVFILRRPLSVVEWLAGLARHNNYFLNRLTEFLFLINLPHYIHICMYAYIQII